MESVSGGRGRGRGVVLRLHCFCLCWGWVLSAEELTSRYVWSYLGLSTLKGLRMACPASLVCPGSIVYSAVCVVPEEARRSCLLDESLVVE